MYNQVIVVEGHHDEQKLKSVYPDIQCIVTNGSSISAETLNLIYQTSLEKEVILFLDPDYPGKKITNEILKTKGNYKIVFIDKKEAISSNKKKVGVEHASVESIKRALNLTREISFTENNQVLSSDLLKRKLINCSGAKTRRENLCKRLNIPIYNGKALIKYLNLLNVSLERIDGINYD